MTPKKQMTHCLTIIAALTLTLQYSRNTSPQTSQPESISFSDLIRMLADQPDHMADRTIVRIDNVIKMKFAKKRDKIRHEFYPLEAADSLKTDSYRNYKIITIAKLNQPTMALDPQEKAYAEAPQDFKFVSFDLESFLKKVSAELGGIKAESVGTETIEGLQATKIRIRFEDSAEEMYFYFARDHKNLFLEMDSGTIKQIRASYTVSNVSFDVPDELFEIPKDYKRVDFNSMISTIKQKALK